MINWMFNLTPDFFKYPCRLWLGSWIQAAFIWVWICLNINATIVENLIIRNFPCMINWMFNLTPDFFKWVRFIMSSRNAFLHVITPWPTGGVYFSACLKAYVCACNMESAIAQWCSEGEQTNSIHKSCLDEMTFEPWNDIWAMYFLSPKVNTSENDLLFG